MGLRAIFEDMDKLKFMLSVEKRKKIAKIPISEIMEEEGISRPTYYNYKKYLDKMLKQLGYKSFLNVYEMWIKNPDILDEIEETYRREFGEYMPEDEKEEKEKTKENISVKEDEKMSNISRDTDLLDEMIDDLNEKKEVEIEEVEEPETTIKPEPEKEIENEPENKKKNNLVLMVGIGAIVISGIIAFFVIKAKNKPVVKNKTEAKPEVKTQDDLFTAMGLPEPF